MRGNRLNKKLKVMVMNFNLKSKREHPTSILVSNANFAKEILKTQELHFVYRPEFSSPDYNIYHGSDFILAPYGTYWRFLKKLCMTKLLSNSTLNQFTHIREQKIMKLLEHIVKGSRYKEFVI
ncbi:hypothetical protein PTKIN_Ptkin13bG0218300 [Pterospermum kingtungense]